ncbi:MAG: DUF2027 domain-containing protein [Bacteroidales bacterium]|nr:DUF2027 domain-containing protein [Bacteroidales bacterium]MCF8349922.1 DUF2027 domain-containing protein [Bacteroidales bacterium]MCF8375439.1 DUF2027 domain-containing protein [Bacteroidales bacterium]MCF8401357.1 DUF2027 domain-containing protein [Bacteroidales bacterium]
MRFKVGDKVRFLNEKGGGVITRIISPSLVNVEIEDGFEVPVVPSELVIDARALHDEESRKSKAPKLDYSAYHEDEPEPEGDERKSPIDKVGFRGDYVKGLYLAFVPQDQKWLVTGLIEVYLINYTGYEMLYSLYLQSEDGFYGYDYDVMQPRTKILLDTIPREEIEKWTKGLLQVMYHIEKVTRVPLPGNAAIDIKPARIYKEGNYRETPLMTEKAFVLNLLELNTHEHYSGDLEQKKFEPQPQTTKPKAKKRTALINQHRTAEGVAVVDLHIGELVDNITGLSSGDMLKIQKEYFIKCLESAMAEGYQRVTFIHGVGNGILKNEIMQLMKDYENLKDQSASLAKFGVGAVDVIIHKG